MAEKILLSLVLCVCAGTYISAAPAPETAPVAAPAAGQTTTPAAKTTTTASADAPAKTSSAPGAAKAVKPKPRVTTRTEAEISGLTSETSDQLYGRLNLTRLGSRDQWWVRGGYGITKTRTYSKKNVNETDIDTLTLDAQYRRDHGGTYRFISAAANIRNRSPHSSVYNDKSGYYMLLTGFGKKMIPGLEAELALAKITRYEDVVDDRITPVYSLRIRTELTDSMVLDGDSFFVQPFSDDPLVDTRMNLTYRLTPAVSVRLTYVANNMLMPVLTRSGWDKSFRVSLVFASTKSQ